MIKSCGVLLKVKDKYLLGRDSGTFKSYSIPKGKQEEGETEAETALRELKEETNITLQPGDIGVTPIMRYTTKRHKKEIVVFAAELQEVPEDIRCIALCPNGEPELDSFLWVTKEEASNILDNHMRIIFNHDSTDNSKPELREGEIS